MKQPNCGLAICVLALASIADANKTQIRLSRNPAQFIKPLVAAHEYPTRKYEPTLVQYECRGFLN